MNPDHIETLRQAAEDQPLGTCSICKAENVHVFKGVEITPSGSETPNEKFVCFNCFAGKGHFTDVIPTRRSKFASYMPPIWIRFILMNPKVFFTISGVTAAAVCWTACFIELFRSQVELGVIFSLIACAMLYLTTVTVDHWQKKNREQDDD